MKVLIINNHPDKESFNFGIARAYRESAQKAGHEVKDLIIRELRFDPNLQFGYRQRMVLEPDLVEAQNKLKWANHMAWIYPVWWGGLPALAKGFMDRVFLPGFAWDEHRYVGLLKGKTAHVINTMDHSDKVYQQMQNKAINDNLEFVGIKVLQNKNLFPITNTPSGILEKWLNEVKEMILEMS